VEVESEDATQDPVPGHLHAKTAEGDTEDSHEAAHEAALHLHRCLSLIPISHPQTLITNHMNGQEEPEPPVINHRAKNKVSLGGRCCRIRLNDAACLAATAS
jgi:hypothetical protein